MEKLNLGIIGMSEGNGHPYSWSAIFNGFDSEIMASCPFPIIPKYLNERKFPEDFLNHIADVTHIYTQDPSISKHIAEASKINNIVQNPKDLIGKVDAVLLARDDAENHYDFAKPFLKAGMPIFIDKPIATSIDKLKNIYSEALGKNQIYTCSALRYSSEVTLSEEELNQIGNIKIIEANSPKYWNTYSIHLIEPIIVNFPNRGKLLGVERKNSNNKHEVLIKWQNLQARLLMHGKEKHAISFNYIGEKMNVKKFFTDSFNPFKVSLENFTNIIIGKGNVIPFNEIKEIVTIINLGK